MNLLAWLNEQKLPIIGDGLKEKCALFKLEKIEALKKFFATLSAGEIVKLLNIPMSFEALADGVHLLESLQNYEQHKTYPPWTEVKDRFILKTTPNDNSEVKMNIDNWKSTTIYEILSKWDGEYKVFEYCSPWGDEIHEEGDCITFSVTGSRDEKKLAELLEFFRLEFYARMIPVPNISIQFDREYQYPVEM